MDTDSEFSRLRPARSISTVAWAFRSSADTPSIDVEIERRGWTYETPLDDPRDSASLSAHSNPSAFRSVVVYKVFLGPRHPEAILALSKLGEFELLVLLAVLRNPGAPYANRVREDLEENAGRRVTRGALYRTLDRLTEKGLVAWALEPSETPERGGHPMRRLSVTTAGREAVRRSRDVLLTFLEGVDPTLDGG